MPKLKPATEKLRNVALAKSLLKHGGNAAAVARERGVSRASINELKQKPAVQDTLQKVIDKCLKDAGITPAKVYGQLADQLQAHEKIEIIDPKTKRKKTIKKPLYQYRDSARKDALDLMRHRKNKVELGLDNDFNEVLKQTDTAKILGVLSQLK